MLDLNRSFYFNLILLIIKKKYKIKWGLGQIPNPHYI